MTTDEVLEYINDNNYEFINVTFLPEFDFIPGSITNILSFENCDFKASEFVIGSNDYDKDSEDKNIVFENCTFNEIEMKNTSNLFDISFYDSKIKKFILGFKTRLPKTLEITSGSEINTLEIENVKFENRVIFKLDRLDYFHMYSSINTGFFCLTTYHGVRILKIIEFTNSDYFELDGIRNRSNLSGRLVLSHSNFGYSKFNKLDLSNYHSFDYYNNSASEITCNDCVWKINFTDLDVVAKIQYFKDLRSFSEKGTLVHTEVNKRYLDLLFKEASTTDKLILIFSKVVSNHCTNWFLPILFLFLSNLSAMYLINFNLDYKLLSFKDFAVLMNPLHLYSHYSFWGKLTASLPDSFYILDVIFRGVNAVVLYHLVKTFRRFHS